MHIMKHKMLIDVTVSFQIVIRSVFRANKLHFQIVLFLNDLDICGWVLSLQVAPFSLLTTSTSQHCKMGCSTALRKKIPQLSLVRTLCFFFLSTQIGMGIGAGTVVEAIRGILTPLYFFLTGIDSLLGTSAIKHFWPALENEQTIILLQCEEP